MQEEATSPSNDSQYTESNPEQLELDDTSNLGGNIVTFDFEDLEPVAERVKLEGDEYQKSYKRRNRDELTASATMEMYRSLDSLPIDHKI